MTSRRVVAKKENSVKSSRIGWILSASLIAVMLAPTISPAGTGRKCVPEVGVDFERFQKAQSAALGIYEYLNSAGADVAIVARIGTDQSARGITYTHAGLVFRNHPKGTWIFTHLLRDCEKPESDIFNQGLFDFFNQAPVSYRALVAIPVENLQARLEELNRGPMVRTLHEPRYSTLANPFRTRFQNSNQWVLEMIAAAIGEDGAVRSREDAVRVIGETGYQPARMKLKLTERVVVKAGSKAHVSLADHKDSENRGKDGGYFWVSAISVVEYLERNGLVLEKVEIPLEMRN